MAPRTVAVLVYDGCLVLDVMHPAEVFWVANDLAGQDAYDVSIVSLDGEDVIGASGVRIGVERAVAELDGPIDTLLVPGGPFWAARMRDEPLLAAIRAATPAARRVSGVCTGSFLLGAAGLLEGRRATTHWMFFDEFAECFPNTELQRGPIFVHDEPVFTSAGGTAAIDLALAMVEADHGPAVAREAARFLVVFMQRPGGHTQFSVRMASEPADTPLRGLLDAIAEDPAADHRLSTLSERAGFSERHLTRVFMRDLGMTPARYVEEVRVELARSLLESSDAPLDAIARDSGLGSAETLRRTFTRHKGVTPHAYRQRFRTTGVNAA